MRFKTIVVTILIILMLLLTGCGKKTEPAAEIPAEPAQEEHPEQTKPAEPIDLSKVYLEPVELETVVMESEAVVIAEAPEAALPDILEPVASGELVKENERAIIDYSNFEDGYVMILFTGDTEKKLKAQIKGPTTTYTYNLTKGEWAVFPLSDGNGSYQFKVYQNVRGSEYSLVLAEGCEVTLSDEFAPFIRPNQYVNYTASSKTVEKARELTEGMENPLFKVAAIYDFVVTTLSYDDEKASSVKSGYVPVLDEILESEKGICFDYASLMTGMLRSQGVPCKMIFGYAGSAYHAWINVWTEDTGWVDGVIYFDGTTWQRLDPTFASSANQSESIMKYIGNGKNYKDKYMY